MLDLLARLDDFLVDNVAQRLADAAGARWGVTCQWLARQCLLAKLCLAAVTVAVVWTGPTVDLGSAQAIGDFYDSVLEKGLTNIALSAAQLTMLVWGQRHFRLERDKLGTMSRARIYLTPVRYGALSLSVMVPPVMLWIWLAEHNGVHVMASQPPWLHHAGLAMLMPFDPILLTGAAFFASCSSRLPKRKPKTASAWSRLFGRLAPTGA